MKLAQNSFGELLTTLPPESFSKNCFLEDANLADVATCDVSGTCGGAKQTSNSAGVVGGGGLNRKFVVAV